MKKLARSKSFSFPYLFDTSQEVANASQAACTPDFFLFDNELELSYRGIFDISHPENETPMIGSDLRSVYKSMLRAEPVPKSNTQVWGVI